MDSPDNPQLSRSLRLDQLMQAGHIRMTFQPVARRVAGSDWLRGHETLL
jgi:hypothetical protein